MSFAPPTDRSSRSKRGGSVRTASHMSVMSRSSSMSRMSTRRLQKLRDLHTRALLGDTLKQRLTEKHNGRIPDDVLQAEVDKITAADRATITTSDVRALDEAVAAKAAEYPTPRSSRPTTALSTAGRSVMAPSASTGTLPLTEESVLPVVESRTWGSWSGAGPTLPPKPKISPRSKAEEEWVLVMRYEAMEAEKKAREAKEAERKKRAELVNFLSQQLKEKEENRKKELAEQDVWAKVFEKDTEDARTEEEKVIAARREVALKEKAAREEQMKYRQRRKELEAEAQARFERSLIEKVVAETKELEAKAAAAKLAEKERYRQIFIDNQKELERKKQLQDKEVEEDRRRMEEYARVMEEQERKRQAYWDEFAEKQKKLAEAKVAFQAADTSGRVLMSDEKFAEQEAAREREEEAKLQAKLAKKKAEDAACREFIKEQLKRKEEERRREAEEERLRAARAIEEMHAAERVEAAKEADKRQRAAAYRQDLVQQISNRTAESNRPSEEEVRLNRERFEAARATFRASHA